MQEGHNNKDCNAPDPAHDGHCPEHIPARDIVRREKTKRKKMPIRALKPTQHAVGYHQVEKKKNRLKKMMKKRPKKFRKYLEERPIPVVKGPKKKHYLIDRHHHGSALLRAKQKHAPVEVVADLSSAPEKKFWEKMDELKLVHPHDENGERAPFKKLPDDFAKLKDDPYRSLAGFVRKMGGYQKVDTPFAEFQWADFFRDKISKKTIKNDFNKALKKAMRLAHDPEASHLPGYIAKEEFQLNAISMLDDQSGIKDALDYPLKASCLTCRKTYLPGL